MTDSTLLPIGELAAAAGVTARALRHYEELGLIASAARVGGKRRFDVDNIDRVTFIRRSQRVGFSLDEIRFLLDDTDGGWNEVVAQKLVALRAQRSELDSLIETLEGVQSCGCRSVTSCSSASLAPQTSSAATAST